MEKVCVNHPESPSVGSCKACEKPVCLMCIVEVQGVSFCSDACGSAYQEVKDWLERPAADEEWNPLADAKAPPEPPLTVPATTEATPLPAVKPATDEASTPSRKTKAPTGTEMRAALSSAFTNADPAAPFDPIPQAPAPAPASNRTSLYIAIAATVLIVAGLIVLFNSSSEPPSVTRTDPPKVEPPKPEPPKPEPPKPEVIKSEPPKPLPLPPPKPEPVKPEPAKPEPVKPPPPKPEPPKPEPVKPPPPPPPKPEPVKPEVVKPEPPKPEPVKPPPPPPPKPEPVKPEVVKPEPPKPEPPKPEPAPAPHLAFVRDPWGKDKPGTWYRIKTSSGGQESYRDIGLRESGTGYRVLVSQTNASGKTEPEQFTWTEPEETSLAGSVNGDAQGTKYSADVVRTKSSRPSQYVFKDGPHAGAVFPSDAVLTRLGQETLKVKDRAFPCSVMETELKEPKRSVKTWFSIQLPLGAVKTESEGTVSALIDFGDDWAKRPPFPEAPVIAKVDPPKPPPPPPPPPPKPEPVKPEPPKPEPPKPEPVKPEPPKPEPAKPPPPPPPKPEPPKPEPKPEPRKEDAPARVKKSMADAAGLIREATPMYQEVAGAMDSLPKDRAALRDLTDKAERVSLKLADAKILYASVKGDAPDPATLDRRLAQLDELLASIQDFVKQLKKKLQ